MAPPVNPQVLLPHNKAQAITEMRPDNAQQIIQDLSYCSSDVLAALNAAELLKFHDNFLHVSDHLQVESNVSPEKMHLIQVALAATGEGYQDGISYGVELVLGLPDKFSVIVADIITITSKVDSDLVDELLKLHESTVDALTPVQLLTICNWRLPTHSAIFTQEISDLKIAPLKLALELWGANDDMSNAGHYIERIALLLAFQDETITTLGNEGIVKFITNPILPAQHLLHNLYDNHPTWEDFAHIIEPYVLTALGAHDE